MSVVYRFLRSRVVALGAVGALVAIGLVPLAPPPAEAVNAPFERVFTANTSGVIIMRGNANHTCAPSADCTAAQTAGSLLPVTTPAGNAGLVNNATGMVLVDADSQPAPGGFDNLVTAAAAAGTTNSSAARVPIPAGGSVLFAGLYWGGNTARETSQVPGMIGAGVSAGTAKTAKLLVPGEGTYRSITSSRVYTKGSGGSPGEYSAFADVTDLVRTAGAGDYAVADIPFVISSSAANNGNRYGGWSLVVAYADPAEPVRNLTVYNGYQDVSQGTNANVIIPVSGFRTPPSGPVRTRVGVVAWEGDRGAGYRGDLFALEGRALTNAANPAAFTAGTTTVNSAVTNSFNSTISQDGSLVPGRIPAYNNTLGLDIDRYETFGFLANDATSANLRFTTAGESYQPAVVTFTTELFAPDLKLAKAVLDSAGDPVSNVAPLDRLTYRLDVTNAGGDDATDVEIRDPLPVGVTFVPESVRVNETPTTAFTFDGTTGTLTVPLPDIPVPPSTPVRVEFDVTVDADVADAATLTNTAQAEATGRGGQVVVPSSNPVPVVVVRPRADLVVTKTGDPDLVQVGPQPSSAQVTYTLRAANLGPGPDPGVGAPAGAQAVLEDTLPPGVVSVEAPPECVVTGSEAAGWTVRCVLGTVTDPFPVGEVRIVEITATLARDTTTGGDDPDSGDPTVDTARVLPAAGTVDPDPANNEATASTAVNQRPRAVDDEITLDPGESLAVSLSANDVEPDAADEPNKRITDLNLPAGVTIVPGTPSLASSTPGFKGRVTGTYVVSDGRGGSDTGTIVVNVRNAPPSAGDDSATIRGGAPTTLDVLANDVDPNGGVLAAGLAADVLSITGVTQPAQGGSVAIVDGKLEVTPPANYSGPLTFTYTVCDDNPPTIANAEGATSGPACDIATVTLTVNNSAPLPKDDDIVLRAYSAANVTVAVLEDNGNGKDTEPEGQALTVLASTGWALALGTTTEVGLFTCSATTNDCTFDPDPGFVGTATFPYAVSDPDRNASTAQVRITVPNAPPVAGDDSATTGPGAAVEIPVLANDIDGNGDPLQPTQPTPGTNGGTVVRNPAPDTFVVEYTPKPGFKGVDTFTYVAVDGRGGSDTGAVTVTVGNAPPQATGPTTGARPGATVTVGNLLAGASDPNIGYPGIDETLSVFGGEPGKDLVLRDSAGNPIAGATVTLVGEELNVSVPADFVGDARVSYLVCDNNDGIPNPSGTLAPVGSPGGGTTGPACVRTEATVQVTNNPPVAVDDSLTVSAWTRGDPAVKGNLLDGTLSGSSPDSDPDGDKIVKVTCTQPTTGTITCNDDGTFEYTPLPEFAYVQAVVTYTITDEFGATATGTLTIKIQNTAPDIVNDTATAKAGVPVDVPVLDNDSDLNGDKLRVFSAGNLVPPANGTLTINPDGTITYTPNPGWAGMDRFSYTAVEFFGNDAEGNPVFGSPIVADVDITIVNDPPLPLPDEIDTPRFTPIAIAPLDNDSDPNPGQAVRLESFTQPPPGQGTVQRVGDTLVYTPPDDPDFYVGGAKGGVATFEVTVCDILPVSPDEELCTTTTVTVSVAGEAPVLADDTATVAAAGGPTPIDVLGNDTDPNGGTLTVRSVTQPPKGATVAIVNGQVVLTPLPGYTGPVEFTYEACEPGGLCATATVRVQLTNTPPVAVDDTVRTERGAGPVTVDVLGNDTDANGQKLVISDAAAGSGARVEIVDGRLRVTPADGFVGPITVTYTVCDSDGACDTATLTVTVSALDVTAAKAVCVAGAPYLAYDVRPQYVDAPFGVTITWSTPDGETVLEQPAQPLSGRVLWPGAAVDADGTPTDWPGWELVDGEWAQTDDDLGANLRPSAQVTLRVNPEATVTVAYPSATSDCASPAVDAATEGADGPDSGGDDLADTGSSGVAPMLALAAGLIAAGAGLRLARRRAA